MNFHDRKRVVVSISPILRWLPAFLFCLGLLACGGPGEGGEGNEQRTLTRADPLTLHPGINGFTFTLIARDGFLFSLVTDPTPALNDNGDVVFVTNFLGRQDLLVSNGDSTVGIDIASHELSQVTGLRIDNAGHVALTATRRTGMNRYTGAYSIDTSGSGFVTLREFLYQIFTVDRVNRPIGLSPNGTVAFSSIVDGRGAIFRGPVTGPVTELVTGSFTFYNSGSLDVNDSGTVAVQMEYTDPHGGLRRGILLFDTPNQPLATVHTAIERAFVNVQPRLAMNASGQVAFALNIPVTIQYYDPPSFVHLTPGVYVASPALFGYPANLTRIADTGGGFSQFRRVVINDKGLVLFEGLRNGAYGIYAGPDPVADKILEPGDILEDRPITEVTMGYLNNSGQLTVAAKSLPRWPFDSTQSIWRINPPLPNLVPMFPDISRAPNNFIVTNRLGGPTLEFEILTANIGGQDWVRPPINRSIACTSSAQYFRMPKIYEYSIFWYDDSLEDFRLVDQRRKDTVCIHDDGFRGNDPQVNCLQEHGATFPCACDSLRYGAGAGNGVSKGWANSDFRGLAGQWAYIGPYTGDFILRAELDPDQLLQAGDLLDRERDATHDDNISYVYFRWDGTGVPCGPNTCVTNVQVVKTFAPVCPM